MGDYNGWTNWDTWAANLWLTNDEGTYHHAQEIVNADMTYEARVLSMAYLLDGLGNPDEVDYHEVDWSSIIQALREE